MKNNNNMGNKFHQTARIIKRKANDDEEEDTKNVKKKEKLTQGIYKVE
jgi:hypothetical protein